MSIFFRAALSVLLGLWISISASGLGQADENGKLHVELNNIQKSSTGCRLSFVMKNSMRADIENLSFEIVLFDNNSRVNRILTLKGGALPYNKTRVKRFDIRKALCPDISRILINSVEACKGNGLNPTVCLKALTTSTLTKTAFGI